jgi:hypothetical protein
MSGKDVSRDTSETSLLFSFLIQTFGQVPSQRAAVSLSAHANAGFRQRF